MAHSISSPPAPATTIPPVAAGGRESGQGARLLGNVLWNGLAVGASVFAGLVFTPYVIRTLGDERYGLWALAFVLVDYVWFFDLGLNTAIVNFVARFQATGERHRVNEVINTALGYFSGVSVVIIALTIVLSLRISSAFTVPPAYHHQFALLVLLIGLSWAIFAPLHVFTSALDGLQRFDLTSRTLVLTSLLKSGGCVAVLALGYGLIEMALVAVSAQLVAYALNYAGFRRTCPFVRISLADFRVSMLKELARYGIHSFVATAANLLLNQSVPVLIGHFQSAAHVGYFAMPTRLLQYSAEGIDRVGLVTRSSAAELRAKGLDRYALTLAIYSNRYCFILFVPLALFLLISGRDLIRFLITAEFASHAAPLLPILVPAFAFAMAGQFNSGSILFGLSRHQRYARVVMLEAILSVVAMVIVIPRHGILGAAWVAAVLMVLSRGLATPWLLCRSLHFSFPAYMRAIYLRAIIAAIPVAALAGAVKAVSPSGPAQLIVLAAVIGVAYFAVAFSTCLEPDHRRLLLGWLAAHARATR